VFVVVLVTCPSVEEARRIARVLLEERLAACINIVPGLTSLFWWEGKLDEAQEALMIIKTRASLLPELTTRVRELHPYEVPEVVALPIVGGSEDYLSWVGEEARRGREAG